MMHAQLDENGICTGYGNLTNIESNPRLVYLPDGWDEDLLWRKYENGSWSVEKFSPPAPELPISLEEKVAQQEQKIIDLKKMQSVTDRVVAENGLMQQEILELLLNMGE